MKIRLARQEDAQQLLQLYLKLDVETNFMLMSPGERSTDIKQQAAVIAQFEQDQAKTMLVAELGHIVGFCVLLGGQQLRAAHVASIVMGVEKSAWGKGVGGALLARAIRVAGELQFSRLELTVHTANQAAIKLYKKQGFIIEGERVSSVNLGANLVNEYYMARLTV